MDRPCRRQEQQQRDGGQDEAAPRALGRIAGGRQLGFGADVAMWQLPAIPTGRILWCSRVADATSTLLSVQTSLAGEVPSRFMEAGTRPMQGFAAVLMAALAAATPAWATSSAADRAERRRPDPGAAAAAAARGRSGRAWSSCCPTLPVRTPELDAAAQQARRARADRRARRPARVPGRQDAQGRGLPLPGQRPRGGEPADPGRRRSRPLSHADRRRHRHGGRRRLCGAGPVARRHPRRCRQRRLLDPYRDQGAALRGRAGPRGRPRAASTTTRRPCRAGGGWRPLRTRPRPPRRSRPPPGSRDALVAAPEGDLGERLVALIEAPLAAATADALAGLPLVELPVDRAGPADGGGLLGRRRLARHRQGHRRPPAGQRASRSWASTACATSGRRRRPSRSPPTSA